MRCPNRSRVREKSWSWATCEPYKPSAIKTNLLCSLKSDVRPDENRVSAKSNLTILLLLFVTLALAGCEGMVSAPSGAASPWPVAATGSVASPASQTGFASGLSGRWYHGDKPTSIDVAPDGRNVTVIDEVGRRTSGYATSPRDFEIPQDHLRGHLSHDGRRIEWTNGGTWTRDPHHGGSNVGQGQGFSGRWYHDSKPTSMSVSPGGSVTITDENGITTTGHMMNNREFVMSSLLRGTFSPDGRRISWSNGTEWTR
jgi:hypothetical protein